MATLPLMARLTLCGLTPRLVRSRYPNFVRITTASLQCGGRFHARPNRRSVSDMLEVRIHGRGGQGVVTAAELLSVAAFIEGKHAQAFPSFGSERTGAPVVSFCRIGDHEIRSREPISHPDVLIVQDPTLLHQVDVFSGLSDDGYLLINTSRSFDDLGLGEFVRRFQRDRLLTVPATELAREHLGRPLPGAPLLGGFAGLTGLISIDSVAAAIREKFTGAVAEGNVGAGRAAYDLVREEMKELTGA
jgi:pyruvate ferredoxin oxidoreductase gamma subunit